MNLSTMVVVVIIAILVVGAITHIVKSHKSGSYCTGCSGRGGCVKAHSGCKYRDDE